MMKRSLLMLTLAAITLPTLVTAEDVGCYERFYSAAHLSENPSQGVQALRVLFYRSAESGDFSIALDVQMSDQGQAARDGVQGQRLQARAFCHSFEEVDALFWCEDVGVGVLRQTTRELLIEANPTPVGPTSLNEGTGGMTKYMLRYAPMSTCAGMEN